MEDKIFDITKSDIEGPVLVCCACKKILPRNPQSRDRIPPRNHITMHAQLKVFLAQKKIWNHPNYCVIMAVLIKYAVFEGFRYREFYTGKHRHVQ